jgi:hypothetical protein
VRISTLGRYSTGCRSPTRWTPNLTSPLWARSLAGCRRARDHRPQNVMLLALSCTSKPANSTGLAFRALISGGVERLELARYTARDLSALAGPQAPLVEDNPWEATARVR